MLLFLVKIREISDKKFCRKKFPQNSPECLVSLT